MEEVGEVGESKPERVGDPSVTSTLFYSINFGQLNHAVLWYVVLRVSVGCRGAGPAGPRPGSGLWARGRRGGAGGGTAGEGRRRERWGRGRGEGERGAGRGERRGIVCVLSSGGGGAGGVSYWVLLCTGYTVSKRGGGGERGTQGGWIHVESIL